MFLFRIILFWPINYQCLLNLANEMIFRCVRKAGRRFFFLDLMLVKTVNFVWKDIMKNYMVLVTFLIEIVEHFFWPSSPFEWISMRFFSQSMLWFRHICQFMGRLQTVNKPNSTDWNCTFTYAHFCCLDRWHMCWKKTRCCSVAHSSRRCRSCRICNGSASRCTGAIDRAPKN